MRFPGLGLADTAPDANTIWTFREAPARARIGGRPAIVVVFERFEAALAAAGFVAMGGQIIDGSIVAAPKQRNSDGEKRAIKQGRIPAAWAEKPAKPRQKDRTARWTVKSTKAKPSVDGAPRVDLAVPAFGYKNHIGVDRRHGLIRRWTVTDAARHDGALLPELIDTDNTASGVWADTVLCGDPAKARDVLGWEPRVTFGELIEMMVKHDSELARREHTVSQAGFIDPARGAAMAGSD